MTGNPISDLALSFTTRHRRDRYFSSTMMLQHSSACAQHVVRLPARGYGTAQFDMTGEERDALVAAGRQALDDDLRERTIREPAGPDLGGYGGTFAGQ